MKSKACTKCSKGLEANLVFFRKNDKLKSGLHSLCRECENQKTKENYKKKSAPAKKRGKKTCTKCLTSQKRSEFPANKATNDGRSSWCRDCHNEIRLNYDWRNYKNAEKNKKYNENYLKRNPEKVKEYQREYKRQYRCDPVIARRMYLHSFISINKSQFVISDKCDCCQKKADKLFASISDSNVKKTINVKPITIDKINGMVKWICGNCVIENKSKRNK